MTPEIPVNLDIRCAEAGRDLGEAIQKEKALNDALAVLEEQGPYAMFLYVRARHKEVASRFEEALGELLRSTLNLGGNDVNDVMEMAKRAADELDTLLFARDLLRNALVYARFHLKAQGGE
jgi:hypothetical protein